jgi:polyhydroxyalkanoate synthesis regulator phasin
MKSSLIPEKPLCISPSLATTIGLEEACMLSLLSEVATHQQAQHRNGRPWLELDEAHVVRLMPFWTDYDVERISRNLRDKGVILLSTAPYTGSRKLCFTFNEDESAAVSITPRAPVIASANRIDPSWQPDQELLQRIGEHNIPAEFTRQQLPEFITYWRERGEISHAWGAKFLKHVLHQWREHQTVQAKQARQLRETSESEFLRRDQETPMYSDWRPSHDALEVLVKHANISLAFVEDAIPEFVLYWQERGDVGRTWNSRFIQHVKRQWLRYNSALEHDTEPRRIADNWQPSPEVYDVLRLANINIDFGKRQVAEFVLFWRDSNQVYSSWNTKFLQHVKYQWAKQHALTVNSQQVEQNAGLQPSHSASGTRDRSLVQDLTDRSWAQ